MIVTYFSVYDKKSRAYGQLFPSNTPGSAERSFDESVNKADTMQAKYPDDFALYRHFDFDDETGEILNTLEPPQLVVEASALKR